MRKEIEIIVPKDWSAITLRKYIELQSDLKAYEGESEAILAAMFYHLCGLTPDILHKLDTETYIKIRDDLFSFTGTLYNFITTIDDVLQAKRNILAFFYKFLPIYESCSKLYIDIETYITGNNTNFISQCSQQGALKA